MAFDTVLYQGPDLLFAELHCPVEDPEWGEHNVVSGNIVALPAAPVWQAHDGHERELMSQNNVVFHHPGSEYHRERFRDVPYRCLFLVPSASLVREIAQDLDPSAAEDGVVRFKARCAPLDARTFGLSRMAARFLRSSGAEPSAVREGLYEVLRGAVRASDREAASPSAVWPATRRTRRELAEAAKEILVNRMAERTTLDDVARALFTTPYHLARVFRTATGFSVHGYLVQLRLRTGFDRIQSDRTLVGDVGRAVGYESHSHFTASFRRAFGMAPSRVARRLSA
jgi:AraC-like DNA-binding protein